jgi:hypothetical protein
VANKLNIRVPPDPPFSPDLAPVDFTLFLRVKESQADIILARDTFKSTLERAIRIITAEEFAAVYRRWLE